MEEEWERNPIDCYKILQVHQSAEPEVVKAAYIGLSNKYHPDKNSGSDADRRMKEINSAHDILKNQNQKRQYDLWYQRQYGGNAASIQIFPKPQTDMAIIHLDRVIPGQKQTSSFVISNHGGDYHTCKVFVATQHSWVTIIGYDSLTASDELPLRVDIEAKGSKWGKKYSEVIIIKLDNEEARVGVELQTRSAGAWMIVWALKGVGRWFWRLIKKIMLWRTPMQRKKVYRWSGAFVLVAAAILFFNSPRGLLVYEKAASFVEEMYIAFIESLRFRFDENLGIGMSGQAVQELQKRLVEEAVYDSQITGYFGSTTLEAVKKYQLKYKIEETGFVGSVTRNALNTATRSK